MPSQGIGSDLIYPDKVKARITIKVDHEILMPLCSFPPRFWLVNSCLSLIPVLLVHSDVVSGSTEKFYFLFVPF
jgi:hypothetical protein